MYNRQNPFSSHLLKREVISPDRKTCHLVLDLKGSNLTYQSGDCVAIFPENDPALVEKILKILKAPPKEILFNGQTISLFDFFLYNASISKVSFSLLSALIAEEKDPQKKTSLENIDYHSLKNYHLWDFLEDHRLSLSIDLFLEHYQPLTPRLYSIASCQKLSSTTLALLIIPVIYETRGYKRFGVATHFLLDSANYQTKIPIFIQKSNHFHLPQEDKDIILMAGGTGLAPFRAFLQERYLSKKGKNWLFFGERHKKTSFYFQEELESWQKEGFLKLSLAFSQDQERKIYVQDRLLEEKKEFLHWLNNGAYLYLCGSVLMAKNVEAVLSQFLSLEELKKEKRYLKDVY